MRKMKDSGIEWIGEIPEGWEVRRGKTILNLRKQLPLITDDVITCFRDGQVTLRKNRREEGFTFSDKEIGYQHIQKGDIVIHGMDGFAGAMGISDSDGKGSPVLIVCQSNQNYHFTIYYLRMLATQNVFLALATGIRERSCDLRWNKIADLLFPLPPLPEQQRIADYLDAKCGEIDSAIEKLMQIIEKLQEYKRSLITQVVTKGLNPKAKMKDSGIDWIDEIPEGWSTDRIKHLFSHGKGLPITKENLTETGIPVISYGQIHSKINSGTDIKKDLLRFVDHQYQISYPQCEVFQYDFVFADTSEDYEGCGNCVYKRDSSLLFAGYHAIILHSLQKKDNRYYSYLFKTDCWRQQVREVEGVKVYSITLKKLMNSSLIIPPLSEQQQIADYLDDKCSKIDAVIAQKQALIEKLTAYKKSLIYEVVTGKREI